MNLRLRPATRADAYALWTWANDADTRSASYGRAPIPWTAHVAWLEERLASDTAIVLIAEIDGGQPVGSVRFDTADGWKVARLSYVVAPEARGQGISRPMIADAVEWLVSRFTQLRVVADVMAFNERSLRVFRALRWREAVEPAGHRFEWPDPPVGAA